VIPEKSASESSVITVGGVANIHGLSVFDAVYSTVGGKEFPAR
jgi:hypothetical protein